MVSTGDRSQSVEAARRALARWEAWVAELEVHPLDEFEYEGALEARDHVGEAVVIAGDDDLMDLVDEIDSRFQALTVEDPDSPFAAGDRPGWWRRRLPISPEYRAYLTGDY